MPELIVQNILFVLWVYFPAAAANMTPILVAKSPWKPLRNWTKPMDFGKTYRGKRIFGAHKTWRGLITGMIVATIVLAIQQAIFRNAPSIQEAIGGFNFDDLPTLITGALFGLGALGGDAIKSFFKRQRGRPPGKTWFPFDQIDLPLGALIATWPLVHPTIGQAVTVLAIGLAAQLIASYVGYKLNLKDSPI